MHLHECIFWCAPPPLYLHCPSPNTPHTRLTHTSHTPHTHTRHTPTGDGTNAASEENTGPTRTKWELASDRKFAGVVTRGGEKWVDVRYEGGEMGWMCDNGVRVHVYCVYSSKHVYLV